MMPDEKTTQKNMLTKSMKYRDVTRDLLSRLVGEVMVPRTNAFMVDIQDDSQVRQEVF